MDHYWTVVPSIHFFLPNFTSWVVKRSAPAGNPDIPLSMNTLQLLLVDLKAFPDQRQYMIPPASSRFAPGSSSSETCLETLQREAPRNTEEQRLYSESLRWWSPSPYLKTWTWPPNRGSSSLPLAFRGLFFWPRSVCYDHKWGWMDQLIKSVAFQLSSFLTLTNHSNTLITVDEALVRWSISSSKLLMPHEQDSSLRANPQPRGSNPHFTSL